MRLTTYERNLLRFCLVEIACLVLGFVLAVWLGRAIVEVTYIW